MKVMEPELKDVSVFLSEFNTESDRGATLTAAALLDESLRQILSAFLIDTSAKDKLLAGFYAPLGTFSAKIDATYCMGLIQENEYRELHIIRRIRNQFAHSWRGVSFQSGKVANLCDQLPWLGPIELEEGSNLRSRFNFAVVILLTDFMWRGRLVVKDKRKTKIWPNKARQG